MRLGGQAKVSKLKASEKKKTQYINSLVGRVLNHVKGDSLGSDALDSEFSTEGINPKCKFQVAVEEQFQDLEQMKKIQKEHAKSQKACPPPHPPPHARTQTRGRLCHGLGGPSVAPPHPRVAAQPRPPASLWLPTAGAHRRAGPARTRARANANEPRRLSAS